MEPVDLLLNIQKLFVFITTKILNVFPWLMAGLGLILLVFVTLFFFLTNWSPI